MSSDRTCQLKPRQTPARPVPLRILSDQNTLLHQTEISQQDLKQNPAKDTLILKSVLVIWIFLALWQISTKKPVALS